MIGRLRGLQMAGLFPLPPFPMKYAVFLLLIALIVGVARSQRQDARPRSASVSTGERERAFVIRTIAGFGLFAVIFASLLWILPGQARVLILLPALVVGTSMAR